MWDHIKINDFFDGHILLTLKQLQNQFRAEVYPTKISFTYHSHKIIYILNYR